MKAAAASKPAAASRTAASSVAAKPLAASKAATAAASAAAKPPSAASSSKAAIASIPTRAVAASAAKKSVVPATSKVGTKSSGPAATTGKQQPRLPAIATANAATAAISAVSAPLAPPSQQLIEQQELAAAAAAQSAAKHARHNGLVTLRYNHYKESFAIADGVLSAAAIDEKFTLSFAFPKSTLYLTAERPDSYEDFSRPLERKSDASTFVDLQVGREYFVLIEEDTEEARLSAEKQREYSERVERQRLADLAGHPLQSEKMESCSCIEGNPCVQSYNCKDWKNRFDVAKAHGWKGHS